MKTPRKYQQEAIDFTDSEYSNFLLDMDCGLGKTFVAYKISEKYNLPTIIIAPKAIVHQWVDELIEEGVGKRNIFLYEGDKYRTKKDAYVDKFLAWLEE